MAVKQIAPQLVSFTPDKVTEVNVQVPCVVQGINVLTTIQELQNQIAALTARIVELESKSG